MEVFFSKWRNRGELMGITSLLYKIKRISEALGVEGFEILSVEQKGMAMASKDLKQIQILVNEFKLLVYWKNTLIFERAIAEIEMEDEGETLLLKDTASNFRLRLKTESENSRNDHRYDHEFQYDEVVDL